MNHRLVSQAVVIATGVRADGWREVLGFAVGDSEDGAFWTQFLRSLKARGLGGVALAHSRMAAVSAPAPAGRAAIVLRRLRVVVEPPARRAAAMKGARTSRSRAAFVSLRSIW